MTGRRVLVTSPAAEELEERLSAAGWTPVAVPTIGIRPPEGAALDAAVRRIGTYDWIVATSANGVAALFGRLRALGIEPPAGARWAAVGPRTAAALRAEGVAVDHVPGRGVGAAIPDGMGDLAGRRVLLARAETAGEDLPRILRERGAEVDDVPAYATVEGPEESRAALERALDAGVEAAIFTSGSTARGFLRLAGGPGRLEGAAVVCIGPSTAAAAREAGLEPTAVAEEPTPAGLTAALERAIEEPTTRRTR